MKVVLDFSCLAWNSLYIYIIKPLACVRVRRFLCERVWRNFQKCACGCVHAPLLGADLRRTSAYSFFVKKSQKTWILEIKKIIEIFLKKCAGAGVRAGAKNGVREPHIRIFVWCACGCEPKSPHTKGLSTMWWKQNWIGILIKILYSNDNERSARCAQK